ncbi:MAG: CopD family protein [Bacteroidota bacterium]
MANLLYFLKALHVVGFVSWFAGLFYLVRMFVYYVEASEKEEPEKSILTEQFNKMQWRVYKIICNPAMVITWTAGLTMLGLGLFGRLVPNYLSLDNGTAGWMYLKLLLLIVLLIYHFSCKRIIENLESGTSQMGAFQFRLFNEVPTLLLVSIVFTATFGRLGSLNYSYLFAGVAVFGFLVYRGAVAYRKRRKKLELESQKSESQAVN